MELKLKTNINASAGNLQVYEKSFFNTILGLSPNWDSKPNIGHISQNKNNNNIQH